LNLEPGTLNLEPGTLNFEPNFAPAFLDQLAARIGRAPAPEETLAYIYALFHSPTYRSRYADSLRTDFPRILLPASSSLFTSLSHFGHHLIALHVLRYDTPTSDLRPPTFLPEPRTPNPEPLLAFRAGGYLALQKWLQPKHRSTADPEYARIAAAIEQTLALMPAIDAAVDRSGGWPGAFAQS
jgi:hypothetical protein